MHQSTILEVKQKPFIQRVDAFTFLLILKARNMFNIHTNPNKQKTKKQK